MRTYWAFFLLLILSLQAVARADPLSIIDLNSKTGWACKKETQTDWQPTAIPNQLPVKGSSDRWIDYQRSLFIPMVTANPVTALKFLSVNDGGQIFINDNSAGTIDYGLFPANLDISKWVTPGKTCTLKVRCFSRNHYYHGGAFPQDHNGDELLGIPRGVSLVIHAPVYIADTFIKPSVTNGTLSYDIWIANRSDAPRTVAIDASFTPWNKGDSWNYPFIPEKVVTLPANSETRVTQAPIKWTLGSESFWWPNIPFKEDYQAKLHKLHIAVSEDGKILDTATQRFGFAERGEGSGFYTINNVHIFQFQDGTQEHLWSPNHHDGFQTSYEEIEGWGTGPSGAAETWRKYLRLGFNSFRLHNSAGSQSMLDAADEVGFMIVGESGIRGYAKPEEEWDPVYKPATTMAMAKYYRSHPCVFRYSLDNEWAAATRDKKIAAGLIDAAVLEDPTRPLSFSQDTAPWVAEFFGTDRSHHAWVMDHYHMPATQPNMIAGIEEDCWERHGTDKNELIECARHAILDRMNGLAVFSPWTLSNYWCNFVTGGSKSNGTVNPIWRNKDRQDGIDGWGSDIVRFMQNGYSIYACADVDLIQHHLNKENLIFDPNSAVTFENQRQISRQMVMFNNSLSSHQMSIAWEIHLDNANGPLAEKGETETVKLNAGEHALPVIAFPCPDTSSQWRTISFVVQTKVDGAVTFTEDRYIFKVKNN